MRNEQDCDSDFRDYGEINSASLLYASLDDQLARRRSVIRNISGRVDFAFVRCVDGRGWSEGETEAVLGDAMRIRRRKEISRGRDWLTKGAIACAATHRTNMIGRISTSGKVLCEDDAVISDAAIELLATGALQVELEKLDGITLFNYRSLTDIVAERWPVAEVGKYSIHKIRPQGVGSAACYFVPARVAPRIVDFQTPLSAPVDHWDEMIGGGAFANLYVVHPRPARIGDFPTTIGYAYARKSPLLERISRVVLLRRLKHVLMRARGDFKERITRWDEDIAS